jgi:hypothetical protein
MSIFKKLNFKDIEVGDLQSVDEMTIVPILGGDRGDLAKPENLTFRSTTNYGTMVFENKDTDRAAIVPANMMVRGKGAQDHAMASSGVVMENQSRSFGNACCIEESQGGLLSGAGDQDVLPITLRKALLEPEIRSRNAYDKLWGKIRGWLEGIQTNRSGSAHLRYFYDTPDIKQALEEFAAEFEPVDRQIGAIIMFSGIPVGIEIMPSSDHWEAYWKLLIRGCYGAEMLRLKMLGKLKPSTLILPEIPQDAGPKEVQKILEHFSLHLREEIIPLLENIEIRTNRVVSNDGELQTTLLQTTSGGGGDLIEQDDKPVYLSLVL